MSNKILGLFETEHELVSAMRAIKQVGLPIEDIYTPHVVHEVIEEFGFKSRISHAAFFYGVFGAFGTLAFLYYTSVIDWPLHFGGKPFNAFPSFIVITIVATILIVTLATLFTFSARAKIFPGKRIEMDLMGATDDKYLMIFDEHALGSDAEKLKSLLIEHGVAEIHERNMNLKL